MAQPHQLLLICAYVYLRIMLLAACTLVSFIMHSTNSRYKGVVLALADYICHMTRKLVVLRNFIGQLHISTQTEQHESFYYHTLANKQNTSRLGWQAWLLPSDPCKQKG